MIDSRALATCLLVTLALTGCAAAGSIAPSTAAPIDTLWYISVRARDANARSTTALADSLEYGAVVVARTDPAVALQTARRVRILDSLRLSRTEFTAQLRARTGPAEDSSAFAVLYVHGVGTSLREAWTYGAEARTRARSAQPWIVFCWPSIGSGMAWPRDGILLSSGYRRDSVSAVSSRPAFVEAMGLLRSTLDGNGRLAVLTHSLGIQVAAEALMSDRVARESLASDPLRAFGFMAADVETGRFRDSLAPALRPLARRIALYASSNDRVLALSRLFTSTERAGLIEGATLLPVAAEGIESIDMTDGSASEGHFQRIFGTHHSVRRANAALFDFVHLVAPGLPVDCRERLGTARRAGGPGVWQLTNVSLPPVPEAAIVCGRSD